MQKLPSEYTQANLSMVPGSAAFPCRFQSLYNQTSWKICCGKKNPAMKYGCGEKAARFRLWMSSMLGEEKMPYCCAAKS